MDIFKDIFNPEYKKSINNDSRSTVKIMYIIEALDKYIDPTLRTFLQNQIKETKNYYSNVMPKHKKLLGEDNDPYAYLFK